MKITAVCQEETYSHILIYTVDVVNPNNYKEVQEAIQRARACDLDGKANEMDILFTFAGDISTLSDFR